ncbi:hypothetical protein ANN_27649 [Periplaneta americana]|uniref:Mos1 transposase HTH domain-containing protein n=1 Tax=Periplaneta americana TaxID=6978 RepID=A0ABQ8RWJ2_PERAM|nr:hypothetical protein ANN_27649 [Periplaneta americana]
MKALKNQSMQSVAVMMPEIADGINMEVNLLDLHVTGIKTECVDQGYELQFEETAVPMVKCEAEEGTCDVDTVKEELKLEITAEEDEFFTESKRQLRQLVSGTAGSCVEQRVVMKFLVNEGVSPAEIHRRLEAQYGVDTLSRSKTFEWCKRLKEGCTSVNSVTDHCGHPPSAIVPENIQHVERLILKNRRITCRELARLTNLSVGTINAITHDHLHFRKVGARWMSSKKTS